MAHISFSIIFVFISTFVVPISNGVEFSGDNVQLWPIWDLKDPKVVFVAKSVVANHNKKANTNLRFVNVVKGDYAMFSGKREYKVYLVISVKNGTDGHLENYDTSVRYRPRLKKDSIEVYIFNRYTERHGSMEMIGDLKNPEVIFAAKFAVAKYNKESNTSLHFIDIVKGKRHVVAGVLYYLVIAVKESNTTSPINYEAVVWERLWMKDDAFILQAFRKLSKLHWI